ncbi:MAG: hypothetical protein MUO21_00330, partial [Nitrososphaeraceae archaeon]|nr:hypothetical protein [Nitrososphaeraceae archaeon]
MTTRTVYYNFPTVPDFITVRNPFVTNQLPVPCDSQLFGGDDYNLLNSLDPTETPVIFEFKSDDSTCSGYFSNLIPILAKLELKFFGAPFIDTITIFGEVFTAVATVTNQNEFLNNTNPDILVANSLINAIQSNTTLNWRYTVTLLNTPGNVSVLLTANYPGTQYNFTSQTLIQDPLLSIPITFTNSNDA